MSAEVVSDELDRPCTRIVSSKLQGAPTWKIKMECVSQEDKAKLLNSGVTIGLTRFKVADYKVAQRVLQCYRCQGFSHIAAACKSAEKCQKCGGEHDRRECDATEPKCANCGGEHVSSSYECPRLKQAQTEREASRISYADMVKKGGDETDCLRLACSIATSIATIVNHRLKHKISTSDISRDVAQCVGKFFKVTVRPELVHTLGFTAQTTPQGATALINNGL
jgi:hypothetical protein